MPQVDRKEHPTGHHVSRIGQYLDHTDGTDSERRIRACYRMYAIDQPCLPKQCVLAPVHRRSTGMGLRSLDRYFEPAHSLHVGDDPDLLAFGFEHRPLLDVELEES